MVTPLGRLKDNTNQEGCLPPVLLLLAYFPLLLPKVNWQLCQIKPLPSPALCFFQQCLHTSLWVTFYLSQTSALHNTFDHCCGNPHSSGANSSPAWLCIGGACFD